MFRKITPILAILALISGLWTGLAHAGEVTGYVEDARLEDRDVGSPLVLMPVPVVKDGRFQDSLFNPELSREFSRRYEEQFGRTAGERGYRNSNRFGSYESTTGEWVNVKQQTEREREFGGFMSRRLLEYHMDNYSKTQPSLREAYAFKERVTNYEVSVAPGYSVKSHYSISGNFIDMDFKNPLLRSHARVEMDPNQFGPTEVRETRVTLNRDFSYNIRVETYLLLTDGIVGLITRKALTASSSVSVSGSTFYKDGISPRETLGLLGYSLGF